MKITIAITGASGTIYAARLLDFLSGASQVERISLVVTDNGRDVAAHELGAQWCEKLLLPKVTLYENDNLFTPIASGSAMDDAMVIVPCSMGMVARVAMGVSDDLISRAADVMLKERGRLIVVPRESPLSLIHLRNMTALAEAGAVILPAAPSFYHHPQTIEQLVESTVERILKQLQINKTDSYQWKR